MYVTAVAAAQSQRFYSGVGIFKLVLSQFASTAPGGPPRIKATDIIYYTGTSL
jgi:hypothetical protein